MVVSPRKTRPVDKIVKDQNTLARILQGLRSEGKVVVLMAGCFELLHVGHVHALDDARSRGDYLVVGVQSDKAAEKARGRGHPLVPAEERMELVASLACVDYVTIFDEPAADGLLRKLRPDTFATGHEHREKTVPERATAKEAGARIVLVGDRKPRSTTKILQKIRRSGS